MSKEIIEFIMYIADCSEEQAMAYKETFDSYYKINDIENAMVRWNHGRSNDSETLERINDILNGLGFLSWFNKSSNQPQQPTDKK